MLIATRDVSTVTGKDLDKNSIYVILPKCNQSDKKCLMSNIRFFTVALELGG